MARATQKVAGPSAISGKCSGSLDRGCGTWRARVACVTALHDDSQDAKMTAMPALRATSLRHVRPVVPLRFPCEEPLDEHLGQSKRHFELCAALYQMIGRVVGNGHAKGADQFVYFDATNPRRCLAPDAFVKLRVKDSVFDTWKTWESGAPDVAFEVLSPSDT